MSVDAGVVSSRLAERAALRRTLLVTAAAVVAVRSIYVWQPLRSDEGGYLLAARAWRNGGEFLYGDYHVDRPPLLMLLYRLAAVTEWDRAIRVLSIPFVLLMVLAVARSAYLLAGAPAARRSAVVAAALGSSPAVGTDQADGELFAVTLVAAAVALTLEAWCRPPSRAQAWLAVGAGAVGSAAVLVKQSFTDALVFIAVLVAAEAVRRRRLTGRTLVVGAAAAAGVLLPQLGVLLWAQASGLAPATVWGDLVSFRAAAARVIWAGRLGAPATRAATLAVLAVASGLVPLAWWWLRSWRGARRPLEPVQWALAAGLLGSGLGVVAGGSYWPHYLLQPVALLSLAVGVAPVARPRDGLVLRRWIGFTVGSTGLAVALTTVVYLTVPYVWFHERTGQWLARAGVPGDTAFVAYGAPSILEAADLPSPYPYLWSLPMRTLDHDQARLRSTLAGPDAPTWVVVVNHLDSWGIDRGGRLRELVEARYRVAATVCGHPVWLRADLDRRLPPPPPPC